MTNPLSLAYGWFYAPLPAKVAALFRIAVGIALFATVILWAPYLREFFSEAGYVSKEFVHRTTAPNGFSLFFFYDAVWFVYLLYAVLVLATLGFTWGVWSRFCAFLVYITYLSFYNRFSLVDFDGTVVLLIVIFFAMFLQSDKAYVPRWYAKRYGTAENVEGWPAKLIQLQMAFIYLFAGLTKFRSDTWWGGGEVLGILNFQYATFNFSWMVNYPLFVNLLTYGTMAIELSFPFWIWFPQTRRLILVGALFLHLGIALFMQVTYFSEIMIACDLIFLAAEDIGFLEKVTAPVRKRLGSLWARMPRFALQD